MIPMENENSFPQEENWFEISIHEILQINTFGLFDTHQHWSEDFYNA